MTGGPFRASPDPKSYGGIGGGDGGGGGGGGSSSAPWGAGCQVRRGERGNDEPIVQNALSRSQTQRDADDGFVRIWPLESSANSCVDPLFHRVALRQGCAR